MPEFKFSSRQQRRNDILNALKKVEFPEPTYVCTKQNGDVIIHFKEELPETEKTVLKEIIETITELKLEK